jgi:hypothetical protein
MKASVADAAGKDAVPSGTARDTRALICFCAVIQGLCRRVCPIISCRFARPQCPRPIAVCYCLLRFANRVSTKLNWGETGGDSSHKHGPQSPWRPVGRELGIRTIEEWPGSS